MIAPIFIKFEVVLFLASHFGLLVMLYDDVRGQYTSSFSKYKSEAGYMSTFSNPISGDSPHLFIC